MTRALRIRPEAESDLAEACRWYDDQTPGLGDQLLEEISRTLALIEQNPLAFAVIHKEVRRALIRRFPYGVFYLATESRLVVLAIMHQARHPRRWRNRIP